jgi:hypothetical protein
LGGFLTRRGENGGSSNHVPDNLGLSALPIPKLPNKMSLEKGMFRLRLNRLLCCSIY